MIHKPSHENVPVTPRKGGVISELESVRSYLTYLSGRDHNRLVNEVVDLVDKLFEGDVETIMTFLYRNRSIFGGRSIIGYCKNDPNGIQKVHEFVNQINHGIYP